MQNALFHPRSSILGKLAVSYALIFIAVFVLAVISFQGVSKLDQQARQVVHLAQPQVRLALEISSLANQGASALGYYILSADPEEKARYLQRIASLEAKLHSLKSTTHSATQLQKIDRIEQILIDIKNENTGVFRLTEEPINNFPALRMMLEQLEPIEKDLRQEITDLTVEMSEESDIYEELMTFRLNWALMIGQSYAYLATRTPDTQEQIMLYQKGIQQQSQILTQKLAEDEDALEAFEDILEQQALYFDTQKNMLIVQNQDDWQQDSYLVRTRISPLITQLNHQIQQLVTVFSQEIDHVNAQMTSTSQFIQLSVLTLATSALVIILVSLFLSIRGIVKPMVRLTNMMNQVANSGEFHHRVETKGQDEVAAAGHSFNHLLNSLHTAIGGTATVLQGFTQGNFTHRIEGTFPGELGALSQHVNTTASIMASAVGSISEVMASVRQGQFSTRLEADLQGDLGILKHNINQSLEHLEVAIEDINAVMSTAADGQLSHRVNAQVFGQLGDLKQGVNNSLSQIDAAVQAINGVLQAFSQGDFSQRITLPMKGDLGALKTNVNSSVSQLNTAVNEISQAMTYVSAGDFSHQIEADLPGQFGTLKTAINGTANTLQNTLEAVNHVMHNFAEGCFTGSIALPLKGEMAILKNNINRTSHLLHSAFSDINAVMEGLECGHFNTRIEADFEGELLVLKNRINQTSEGIETAISSINQVMHAVVQGDLDQQVNIALKGELNTLKDNVNNSLSVLQHTFGVIAQKVGEIAEGDLGTNIDTHFVGTFREVTDNLNLMSSVLSDVTHRVQHASSQIETSANQISTRNTTLSERTEQQSKNLLETSESMRELAHAVKNNASHTQQAKDITESTSDIAHRCGDLLKSAIHAMAEINTSSAEIAQIIGVVDEIAFQTSLLALNASVEAARAGEQGKGFAVVAEEVRNLAQRSAKAAKTIKQLASDSVQKVEVGSELVDRSGETLTHIVQHVDQVKKIVSDIANTSTLQANKIDDVTRAIERLEEITQENAELAVKTASESHSALSQVDDMQQAVGFFRA